MVTNGSPRTGIERHELARPATFPNTIQHLSGPNKTGRDETNHTYIPFRTVIDLHGMKANRVLLLRGALLSIFVVATAADVARAQVFAPAPIQVGPPLLPAPPHTPMQIPALKPSPTPTFPKCRDAAGAECRRAYQNSRHRRLRKAN